jgi:putative hydrolase of the HAD superfamily
LNLEDVFEDIIDILDIRPYCKPMPEAYTLALSRLGAIAQECIFVDDSTHNLAGARNSGITTVLVNHEPGPDPLDLHIRHIADLPIVLSGLIN